MGGQPGIISGTVRDESSRPVAEARVYFSSGPDPLPEIGALTNQQGSFSLTAPSSGTYVVETAADGYAQKSSTVNVSAGQTAKLNVVLSRKK